MEDAELIKGCQKQDRVAQAELFRQYSPVMFGICLRYTKNRDDARDLLHDGFIKVFASIGKFRNDCPLKAWLKTIFVNTAIDFLRKDFHKYPHLEIGEMAEENEVKDEELSDELLQNIELEEALQLVQQLPIKYRLIINLYCIDNYTHRQISVELGITEGTSKSQLSRARALLVRMLEQKKKSK